MEYSEFCVNFKDFDRPRKEGISGILRVMNDEEFLESSIESCIDCLDELVVVYNKTSPESIAIIERMVEKYPDKIRVYKYLPKLYSGNLTQKEFELAKNLPSNSIHLLANYCNYALSKCNYRFVMKIDSDQIYHTDRLREIVKGYRAKSEISSCSLFDYCVFVCFLFYTVCVLKLHFPAYTFLSEAGTKLFPRYFKVVLFLIRKYRVSVSLSGMNLYLPPLKIIGKSEVYMPLGKIFDNSRAILPPFNGIGDTPIFELTSETYFIPFVCSQYDQINGRKQSIIERLCHVRHLLPVGVCWAHFSSNRMSNSDDQLNKFRKFSNYFLNLKTVDQVDRNFFQQLFLFSKTWDNYQKRYYHIVSFSIDQSFLSWLSTFTLDNHKVIRRLF